MKQHKDIRHMVMERWQREGNEAQLGITDLQTNSFLSLSPLRGDGSKSHRLQGVHRSTLTEESQVQHSPIERNFPVTRCPPGPTENDSGGGVVRLKFTNQESGPFAKGRSPNLKKNRWRVEAVCDSCQKAVVADSADGAAVSVDAERQLPTGDQGAT